MKSDEAREKCLAFVGLPKYAQIPVVTLPDADFKRWKEGGELSPAQDAILARARKSVRTHRPGEKWAELRSRKGFLTLFNVEFEGEIY